MDSDNTPTTTIVSMPPPMMPQAKYYDNWGVVEIVLAGLIVTITLVGGILSIVKTVTSFLKSRKDQDKEITAPMDKRITDIENHIDNLKSSEHIDKEFARLEQFIECEKSNREQQNDNINNQLRGLSSNIADERQGRTRLEAEVKGMAANTQRLETALERLGSRIDERFDKVQDLLITRLKQ
mgnify:CR=1 FL=1